MKFKKIKTKMLVSILPVIAVVLIALTLIAAVSCLNMVNTKVQESMIATLNAETGSINQELEAVKATATTLSSTVASSYKTLVLSDYEKMLTNVITQKDIVSGSGIWFAPYAYDSNEKYVGPYVYKDGSSTVVTYDYSNAEYDYVSQEYYTIAESSTEPVITDPYYDPTSDTIMSTCTAPIIADGKFIGCVSVDIILSKITDMIDSMVVGEAGSAVLVNEDGIYLAGVSEDKIQGAVNIADDTNTSMAAISSEVLGNEVGTTSANNEAGVTCNAYYGRIDATNWKLIILVPKAELFSPTLSMVIKLFVAAIVGLLCCLVIVSLQVSSIAKSIQKVQVFAQTLASGDFTVDSLQVSTKDELGKMGDSLNEMFGNNRDIISNISDHSTDIMSASAKLRDASDMLLNEFTEIHDNMVQINDAMSSTSAATEEVNASVEEVNASVVLLASETDESLNLSNDIRQRAVSIEKASRASYASATELSTQFESKLHESIENAKVVENIGELANVIAEIAEEINLLSLNASIEAARAGEQGKGFAVVADEIGKLAGETSNAVGRIQETIGQVQNAFQHLSDDSQDLLSFMRETVNPDYNKFVETANQYGNDAVFFAEVSEKVTSMANDIRQIMNEVTEAIQNIAESSQTTSEISSSILDRVDTVSNTVNEVSEMSENQQNIADTLDSVVKKFQL